MTLVIYQPTLKQYFKDDFQPLNKNVVLRDDPRWEQCLEEFAQCQEFGFDLETFGVESWHPLWWKTNYIRLIQVGLPSGLCMIADTGGWAEVRKQSLLSKDKGWLGAFKERHARFLGTLKDKLFDWKVKVLGANLKFDFTTIRHHFGFIGRQARDVCIISQVLWAGLGVEKAKKGEDRSERCKLPHNLKAVSERVGVEVDKTEQTSNWGWSLSNSQLNYAADDVLKLPSVVDRLLVMVQDAGVTYSAWVECNCVSIFAEMEYKGMPVDVEGAQLELIKYEKKIAEFEAIFAEHFPGVLRTSNQQVVEAFTKSMPGFTALFREDQEPNVSAETLYQLDHPAAKALIEARKLTTAANNLKIYIENSFDGHIRGFFRQIAAGGAGRSTCRASLSVKRKQYSLGAQLQNPPNALKDYKGQLKGVREFIKAPKGYKMIVADGAQMHMRIAAQASGDPLLLKIFNEDFDGHSILAGKLSELAGLHWTSDFISAILGKSKIDDAWRKLASRYFEESNFFERYSDSEEERVAQKREWYNWAKSEAKTYRGVGKTCLYSSLNGSTRGRMLKTLQSEGFEWASLNAAAELVKFFNQSYKKLTSFIRQSNREANSYNLVFNKYNDFKGNPIEGKWGKVVTLTGRHLYLKKYPNTFRDDQRLEVSFTDATAANWLPVESDMIKHWVVEVYNEFCEHPEWDAYIGNLPHDEANFLCLEQYAKQVSEMVYEKMAKVFGRWLSIIPGVEMLDPHSTICDNWSEK